MKIPLSSFSLAFLAITLTATQAQTGSYLKRYQLADEAIIYRSTFDEPGALTQPGWSVD